MINDCNDCGGRFCTECSGRHGRCSLCNRALCPDCFGEAHRERIGVCGMCKNPPPDDSDLEGYTDRGFKINDFTERERFFKATSARARKKIGL